MPYIFRHCDLLDLKKNHERKLQVINNSFTDCHTEGLITKAKYLWLFFICLKSTQIVVLLTESLFFILISSSIIIIYPLSAGVVGAAQMFSQPVSSTFPCSPLPSLTWRTPGLSIPWCCLPTSSSVCLVFFPLSLCLARWFWPDLMNGWHDHTTAVCISLRWSGGLRVVQFPAGSWHGLPRW